MKKRIFNILLILAVVLSLFAAGCGKEQTEQAAQNSTPAVTEAVQTPTAEPEETAEPAQPTDAPVQTPDGTPEPEMIETPEGTQEPEMTEAPAITSALEEDPDAVTVEEDGEYSDKEHVALYLHTYGHLPSNYITKKEAQKAGWDSGAGNLYKVLPGMSIGGDRYGNYEGMLPKAKGRQYYECDINYNPKGKTSGRVTRGPERIIFSDDGLIFYTPDHYNTFEQLY